MGKFLFATIILLFLLIACSGQKTDEELVEPEAVAELGSPNIQIKTGGLEKRVLFEETISQDNCNGSAEITSTIQHANTIIYTLENVTLQDDKGNFYSWSHPYMNEVSLENGKNYQERVYRDGPFTGADYLIITLDLPGLIYAKWRYN